MRALEGSRRVTARIAPKIDALSRKAPHIDRSLMVRFARGHQALEASRNLLNPEGLGLLRQADVLLSSETISSQTIEELLPNLPTVKEPRLGLYKRPFTQETLNDPNFRAFKLQFNKQGDGEHRIIQIATGCANNCLHCGASAEGKFLRFMPYPMVLLLARELMPVKGLTFYDGNDPLQWRDADFDADFGDLIYQLCDMGIPWFNSTTHGFWPGDPYAEPAAHKLREINAATILSIQLFHKEIFPTPDSTPKEEVLQKYAARFAHAINVLHTTDIIIVFDQVNNPNRAFHLQFVYRDFFLKKVLPLVTDKDLREGLRKNVWRQAFMVIPAGKVVGSPYFRRMDITLLPGPKWRTYRRLRDTWSSIVGAGSIYGYGEHFIVRPDGRIEKVVIEQGKAQKRTTFDFHVDFSA